MHIDKLNRNYKVEITPELYNGANRQALEPIIFTGTGRNLYEIRNGTNGGTRYIIRRGTPNPIRYFRTASIATAVTDEQGRTTWVDPDCLENIGVTLINKAIKRMIDGNYDAALKELESLKENSVCGGQPGTYPAGRKDRVLTLLEKEKSGYE